MIGLTAFSILILACLLISVISPVLLLMLWARDIISNQLW